MALSDHPAVAVHCTNGTWSASETRPGVVIRTAADETVDIRVHTDSNADRTYSDITIKGVLVCDTPPDPAPAYYVLASDVAAV